MATGKTKKGNEPDDEWAEGETGALVDGKPPEDQTQPPPSEGTPPEASKPVGPKIAFGKYVVPEGQGRVIAVCERDFECHIGGDKVKFLKDEELMDPAVYQSLMKQQKPVRLELKQ